LHTTPARNRPDLKGAKKPADLPMQRFDKVELVFNVKDRQAYAATFSGAPRNHRIVICLSAAQRTLSLLPP
jgi:hypothetical protein